MGTLPPNPRDFSRHRLRIKESYFHTTRTRVSCVQLNTCPTLNLLAGLSRRMCGLNWILKPLSLDRTQTNNLCLRTTTKNRAERGDGFAFPSNPLDQSKEQTLRPFRPGYPLVNPPENFIGASPIEFPNGNGCFSAVPTSVSPSPINFA